MSAQHTSTIDAQIFDLNTLRAFKQLAADNRALADREAAARDARSQRLEARAREGLGLPAPLTRAELDACLIRAIETEFGMEESR